MRFSPFSLRENLFDLLDVSKRYRLQEHTDVVIIKFKKKLLKEYYKEDKSKSTFSTAFKAEYLVFENEKYRAFK
jgi:hypothetical protein